MRPIFNPLTMNHSTKTYRVGDAIVTRILDLDLPRVDPANLYPDLDDRALVDHQSHLTAGSYDPHSGQLAESIHSWLVRTPEYTILVDTGVGNDKHFPTVSMFDQLQGPYLSRLADAGVKPEAVDLVLLTHLHADHVGWNTRLEKNRWVPTFPNAQHLFSRIEQRYNASLSGGAEEPDLPPAALGLAVRTPAPGVYEESVAPIIEAGLARPIEANGSEVLDGISFLSTPGHSVDHATVRFCSRGEECLFLGDVFHHPLQVYRPDLRSVYCEFPEAARAARAWLMEYASEQDVLCFSSHFAESSAGRIGRRPDGFQWHFA